MLSQFVFVSFLLSAPAPSQNGKDKNETQSKEHSKEKLSNHDENVNHMTKVSSNQITAAVPRGYQSPAVTSDPPKERLQLEWMSVRNSTDFVTS